MRIAPRWPEFVFVLAMYTMLSQVGDDRTGLCPGITCAATPREQLFLHCSSDRIRWGHFCVCSIGLDQPDCSTITWQNNEAHVRKSVNSRLSWEFLMFSSALLATAREQVRSPMPRGWIESRSLAHFTDIRGRSPTRLWEICRTHNH